MNSNIVIRSARFWLLSEITWKKKHTIKQFFYRNKMDVLNPEHIELYLNKYKTNATNRTSTTSVVDNNCS